MGAGGFAAPQGYAPVPAADPAAAAAAAAAATAPAAAAMPEPPPSYDASQHQAQGEQKLVARINPKTCGSL